jgi:hypothetical protein
MKGVYQVISANRKWMAWAGLLGSVLFVPAFIAGIVFGDDVWPYTYGLEDQIAAGLMTLSLLLLLVGVAAFSGRYASATGPLGRIGLGLTALALLLVLLGSLGFVGEMTGWFRFDSWPVWIVGLFGLPLGMTLYALAALRAGSGPKGAALTTIAGGVASLLAFAIMVSGMWPFAGATGVDGRTQFVEAVALGALVLLFVGWSWLGYVFASEEQVVAAKPEALAG